MKILMVLEVEFPHDDRVEKEAASLLNDGHEVHIACFTKKNRPSEERIEGFIVHRKQISALRYKSSVGALKVPYYFNFWQSFLKKLCKSDSYDAIHIHDLPLAKVGLWIKREFGTKLIVDLHENWPAALREATHTKSLLGRILSSDKQWDKYERTILQYADHVITVVEEMRNRIIARGIDEKKIVVVPNTLRMDHFVTGNYKPNSKYITLFYAGGINIHRGLQVVISGLPELCRKNSTIRLWIVGTGSYTENLKKLAMKLEILDKITFFGWKTLQEIADLLSQSDFALIPHLKSEQTDNSSPNKIFQYMYAGKPIIASNCNSISRILKETGTGITYEHNSASAFVDTVEELVTDKEKLEAMKLNGPKYVINKYNWENTSADLLSIYKESN